MAEIFDMVRPILSGLLGASCIYLFVRFTKSSAKTIRGRKILDYGLPFKTFTIVLIPFSIFVVYAASHARDSQIVMASIVASFFVLGAVFSAYYVFFVKFSYDNKFVYYHSPFCKNKKAQWSSLVDVGYSSLFQADYIIVDGIGRIWCSNLLNGYPELGRFLEKKSQELFPD